MKTPTHTMASNLRWTRSGTVWADYLLSGIPYGLRPDKDKKTARALHQALFRALPGESLLLGVCSGLDPAAIVNRMLAGITARPEWVAECEATLDTLERIAPGQRIFWLSVPLGSTGGDRFTAPVKAAFTDLQDWLGMSRSYANPDEIEHRLRQSARIVESIPAAFSPTPATPAQMVWLHQHQRDRGLYRDPIVPVLDDCDLERTLTNPKSEAALSEALLDEGGQTDLSAAGRKRWNPIGRRFLKVADQDTAGDTAEASYQSMLVLADTPDGGMVFPGSEIIGRIDESGLNVDWAMRLNVRSASTVTAENQRALRNLNEQYQQRDAEVSHAFNMLDRVSRDLAEYVAILESDQLEVEVQSTTIFCVSAPTADGAVSQAKGLAAFMGSVGYKLTQPVGHQETMWWAMQPGVPSSAFVRGYMQITTSRNLAALIPLASNQLGDSKGVLLGLNIASGPMLGLDLTCGPSSVILHDLEGGTKRNMSGSLACAGELGSGKSFLLKGLAAAAIERGGRVIVADRTELCEYAKWARAITDSVVVDVVDPQWSLDPLRLFEPADASRITQSFLIPLLGINPTGPAGVTLAEVLDPDYLVAHQITGSGMLVRHLESGCAIEGARELARMIKVYSRKKYGRVIFDDTVPTMDLLTARAIVVNTHTLMLPSEQEIAEGHLFDKLIPEKLFGRAAFALIALIARQICFADDTFSVFLLDETHAVTSSQEGEREIIDFLRDGRKHDAAVFLGSHNPMADFGSETLRGLIPVRVVLRQRDRALAIRSLDWLGLDPTDEGLIDLLTKQTSPITSDQKSSEYRLGEYLIRDAAGNIGRGKGLGPQRAETREAARTDRRDSPVEAERPQKEAAA